MEGPSDHFDLTTSTLRRDRLDVPSCGDSVEDSTMNPPLALILASAAALLLLSGPLAFAAPSATAVQATLDSNSNWDVVKLDARGGVDVYKKDVSGSDMPGFKGVKLVDVSSEFLFDAINDFNAHTGLSKDIPLVKSRVLKRSGNTLHVFAYLDVPGWTLANDRYWFVEAKIQNNLGGVEGHHKQTWKKLDASLYPSVVAEAHAISSSAVLVETNHGSWEVIPQTSGKTELIYRVLSAPGGRIPNGAQALVTGQTLPENLLQFEAEAKRRARE